MFNAILADRSYPIPQKPQKSPDEEAPAVLVTGGITSKITPKGPTPQTKHGKNDTFGAFGVWGKSPKQLIEPMVRPSDREADRSTFGVKYPFMGRG
jgi:hypothetical protein